MGGRVQPGSGSSPRARGDVKAREVLEELKFTDAASYPMDVRDWATLRRDAHNMGREPRLVIDFKRHGVRLVVVEEPAPKTR